MTKNTKLIINIFIVVGCLLFVAGIVLLWRSGKLDPYINYFKKKQSTQLDDDEPISDGPITNIIINRTDIIFYTNKVTINGNEYLISDDKIDKVYLNNNYLKLFINPYDLVAVLIKKGTIKEQEIDEIVEIVYRIYQNKNNNYIFLEITKKDTQLYILLQDATKLIKFYLLNKKKLNQKYISNKVIQE